MGWWKYEYEYGIGGICVLYYVGGWDMGGGGVCGFMIEVYMHELWRLSYWTRDYVRYRAQP